MTLQCTLDKDNQLWFNGLSIAQHLQLETPSRHLGDMPSDEKRLVWTTPDTTAMFININGVYRFMGKSKYWLVNTFRSWFVNYLIPEMISREKGHIYEIDYYKLKVEKWDNSIVC